MSVINTNVKSLVAQDSLRANNMKLATAMERLSTGSRINRAADDAAGMAIATKMTAQVRGLSMAIKNANDGIALVQTADGAMTEVTDMLQRMRELAIQSGNSTSSDEDRAASQLEITALKSEITRISKTTQYNNMNILDGSFKEKQLQVGSNAGQIVQFGINAIDADTLGELATGPAIQASQAKLVANGVTTNAADYQGKTFQVNVNGVASTVSLPGATVVPKSAATITGQAVGVDRSTAASFVMSDTSVDAATQDMSGLENRGFDISVAGGAYHSVDITAAMAEYFGVDEAAVNDPTLNVKSKSDEVTGDAFVKIVQKAIDDTGLFTGADKVTVSLDNKGFISMSTAGGKSVNLRDGVSLTDGTTATTFVATFINTAQPAGTLDFSTNEDTEFKIEVNNSGVETAINLRPYLNDTSMVKTRSAVTKDELVNVLNKAVADAGFTGNDAVQFSVDAEGYVNVFVPKGLGQATFTEATLTDGSGADATFVADFLGGGTFDRLDPTVDLSAAKDVAYKFQENDLSMSVSVNGSDFVSIDMSSYILSSTNDPSKLTGHEMAAALQKAFNDEFKGENAVTVSLNGDGALEFHTANNEGVIKMKDGDFNGSGVDGTFVGTYIDASGDFAINYNDVPANVVNTGDVVWELSRDTTATKQYTETFSYAAAVAEDRVAAFAETPTTIADGDTLELHLDGHDPVVVNLTAGDYNTLDDLAASINLSIKASGAFTGENAITAKVYRGNTVADPSVSVQYLALENAGGKKITIDTDDAGVFGGEKDSFIDDAAVLEQLGITPNSATNYDTSGRLAGGVDTTANNGVVSIQVASGDTVISKQVQLSKRDANMSFADFATQLVQDANAAFAGSGVTFSGGVQNGQLSFGLANSGDKTLTLSGDIVKDAFGADQTARGSNGDYRVFKDMTDVVDEINHDLSAAGVKVSFDDATSALSFQVTTGEVGSAKSAISIQGDDLAGLGFGSSLSAVGVDSNATAAKVSAIDITTIQGAESALSSLDNALTYVSSERAKLGALQNRLDHTVNNLTNVVTNTEDSRSRIQDADYSKETTALAKSQILTQAATAMLAQANQSAQGVLSLLK